MSEETKVKVSLGITANIGNFENIRIDIGIEDHKRQGETTNQATERVYAFVEKKLEEKLEETMSEVKKTMHNG